MSFVLIFVSCCKVLRKTQKSNNIQYAVFSARPVQLKSHEIALIQLDLFFHFVSTAISSTLK